MFYVIGAIVLVAVGAAGGWYAKGKYGTKIGAIVTDVKTTVADAKK